MPAKRQRLLQDRAANDRWRQGRCHAAVQQDLSSASLDEGVNAATTLAEADPAQDTILPAWHRRRGLYDFDGRLMLKNLTYSELEQWCLATGGELAASSISRADQQS